jgi:hypothetical protein
MPMRMIPKGQFRTGLALVDRIGRLDLPTSRLAIRVGIATGLVVVEI